MKKRSALLAVTAFVTGCITTVREDHYLRSIHPETGETINYFRLGVNGRAWFSAARYVAGYYDERAVDLFFNQIKSTESEPGQIFRPIFVDDQKEPGADALIRPLTPTPENGTFVMVLSTNAKAVTDAIGQFAENQVAADALTNLVNRSNVRALTGRDAEFDTEEATLKAVAHEIEGLFGMLLDDATRPEAEQALLRILNAIAASQGATDGFASIAGAKAWFDALQIAQGDT